MAVKKGNSRQMTTLDSRLYDKVIEASSRTGLSVSKVIAAGAADLVDPEGDGKANENAKMIRKSVKNG